MSLQLLKLAAIEPAIFCAEFHGMACWDNGLLHLRRTV